jgi:hypothetical protein
MNPRQRLPNRRASATFEFVVGGLAPCAMPYCATARVAPQRP